MKAHRSGEPIAPSLGLEGVRRISAAIVTIPALLIITAPAAAKGVDEFAFDGYFVPGTRASSVHQILLHSKRLLRSRPISAYLARMDDARFNHDWPSPRLGGRVMLGQVVVQPFRKNGLNYARAKLSFVVPDVPVGFYEVHFCDRTCDRRMKRLGVASIYVVADHVERRVRTEIDDLSRELWHWEAQVGRLHDRVQRLQQVVSTNRAASERSGGTLSRRIDALSREPPGRRASRVLPWGLLPLVVCFALGFFVAHNVSSRANRRGSRSV